MLSGQNESCPFSLDCDGNNKDGATKGWQRGLFFFFLLSVEASKERLRKLNNCAAHPPISPLTRPVKSSLKTWPAPTCPWQTLVLFCVPIHDSTGAGRQLGSKFLPFEQSASSESLLGVTRGLRLIFKAFVISSWRGRYLATRSGPRTWL